MKWSIFLTLPKMNSTTSLMSPCSGTTSNSSILRRSTSRVQETKCVCLNNALSSDSTHFFQRNSWLKLVNNLWHTPQKISHANIFTVLPPGRLVTCQLSNIRFYKKSFETAFLNRWLKYKEGRIRALQNSGWVEVFLPCYAIFVLVQALVIRWSTAWVRFSKKQMMRRNIGSFLISWQWQLSAVARLGHQ